MTKGKVFAIVIFVNHKNKNDKNNASLKKISSHLGIFLMTAATAISGLDLAGHTKVQVALLSRPATVLQEENINDINSLRRERDETAPHYISYSETQRTPSRSSKH